MPHVFDAIPYVPFIRKFDASENRKISDLCSSLHSEAATLQSCIALFDHASTITDSIQKKRQNHTSGTSPEVEREDRVTRSWPFIAAREALSSLYNFHWALKELSSVVNESAARERLPNPTGVETSLNNFEKRFNKALLARHAASHRTELQNNVEKNAHKAALSSGPILKPKGTALMMSDCLVNRTYTGTRKGELLKFDVTWENFVAVLETYNEVIAFVAVDEWLPPSN